MRFSFLPGLTALTVPLAFVSVAYAADTVPAPAQPISPVAGAKPMIELGWGHDAGPADLLDIIAKQSDVQIVISGELKGRMPVMDLSKKSPEEAILAVVKAADLQYAKMDDGTYLIAQALADITPPPASTIPDGMVLIAGGTFPMGTNQDDGTDNNQGTNTPLNANDARPRHNVTVAPFYLDKTEVTCAEYKKFCDATQYPVPPDWKNGTYGDGKANFPVTRVNWYEANAYAKWAGKRLPTEAEWEKAAAGTDGRRFPWGNEWDPSRVVYGTGAPVAVGSHPTGASPEGVLDLSGNAFEWTSSWFDGYPGSPTKQPDFGTKLRVVRGGAWMGNPDLFQSWYRSVNRPQSRTEWIGFRCAKDVN